MGRHVFVCIDDTDTESSIGTGRLARDLANAIENSDLGKVHGITRHQLLLHKEISYTSNNGNACLEVWDFTPLTHELVNDFIRAHFIPGSNPGLCICPLEAVSEQLTRFGTLTQRDVVSKGEARRVAQHAGVFLKESGDTGQGVIGALAGIGLRATGNDGRFIELRGIRNVLGIITVKEILETTAIQLVVDLQGKHLSSETVIDSGGWLRPYLRNGIPTLIVGGPTGHGIKHDSGGFFVPVRL